MIDLKPSLRSLKYCWLRYYAQQQVSWSRDRHRNVSKPVAFIISCGRSGTTLLGKLFSRHPQVSYLFEPHHLWVAIDPRTDVLNLFHQGDSCLMMNDSHQSEQSQIRFNRLIRAAGNKAKLVIEKAPMNTFRIGYLEAIAPCSKFVHLVRDGVDVCHSINRLATANAYKIAGIELNQWWGVNFAKWEALRRDGIAAGYYPDEVTYLEDNLSRAAYEWLVSLAEVERWREPLGDRLYELTYDTLTTDPKTTLQALCNFFEIDSPQDWLNAAVATIHPVQSNPLTITLPPAMCKAFNRYQEHYKFSTRASEGLAALIKERSRGNVKKFS